jgi:hypothetical protein
VPRPEGLELSRQLTEYRKPGQGNLDEEQADWVAGWLAHCYEGAQGGEFVLVGF